MRITEIVATRCQILRPKCTKFDFGWGSAPDPRAYSTRSPRSLAGFKGPLLLGKGMEKRMGNKVREGEEREG